MNFFYEKNKIKYIISLTFIISISTIIYFTYETELVDTDIDKALQDTATLEYLEKNIDKSFSNNNVDDVKMYLNIAEYLKIKVDNSFLDKMKKENSFYNTTLRNTTHFTKGFIYGNSTDTASLIGSSTSDMLVIGDIRDIYHEGMKYKNDEEYDKLTLGLASLGVALSTSTLLTMGATSSAKVGVSVLKVAKKTGTLSKKFSHIIVLKLQQSANFKLLKKLDYSNILKLKESAKIFIKSVNFKATKKLFDKIVKINNKTSLEDTVKVMKYVDNEKDLNKIVKLSTKYNKNTVGVLKILGKGALKSGKIVIKYTNLLIGEIITLIFSILSFFGFLISQYIFRKII